MLRKAFPTKELKQFFHGFSSATLFCFLMYKGLLHLEFIPVLNMMHAARVIFIKFFFLFEYS